MGFEFRFAFISRHEPTEEQIQLAAAEGIELMPVGDRDAFTVEAGDIDSHHDAPFDGVVVVHPATALRLADTYLVGVFENGNRAAVGAPPQFVAKAIHLFDLRN